MQQGRWTDCSRGLKLGIQLGKYLLTWLCKSPKVWLCDQVTPTPKTYSKRQYQDQSLLLSEGCAYHYPPSSWRGLYPLLIKGWTLWSYRAHSPTLQSFHKVKLRHLLHDLALQATELGFYWWSDWRRTTSEHEHLRGKLPRFTSHAHGTD